MELQGNVRMLELRGKKSSPTGNGSVKLPIGDGKKVIFLRREG